MKRFTKIALAAAVVAGSLAAVAAPADARVFVGIDAAPIAYGPGPVCDPYAPAYNPYYCGYGPAYVGGPVIGFGFGGFHGGFHDGFRGGFHGGGFHGGFHR